MRFENNGVDNTQPSEPRGGMKNGAAMTRKSVHSNGASGGVQNGNGKTKAAVEAPPLKPDYCGHDRKEVTRIMIQALVDLGYHKAANTLEDESGFALESPYVSDFRKAVLEGQWSQAEALLRGMDIITPEVDTTVLLFFLRQQKFLELLERRDSSRALHVLRTEITPLNYDIDTLHFLSSLMMCLDAEDLKQQANWDGSQGMSRQMLLSKLSKFISPSVMIPEHRLASLLHQVKSTQIANCLYHNTSNSPSLYSDHVCDREEFPLCTINLLMDHAHEVYSVEFSHDGRRMASASGDKTIIIWNIEEDFTPIHHLAEHTQGVGCVVWSPDDTHIISCSRDKTAKVWDTNTGTCLFTLREFQEPVSSAAWAPDGQSYVVASLDQVMIQCDIHGKMLQKEKSPRLYDIAITPDGQKIVAVSTRDELHVYDFHDWANKISYSLQAGTLTCVNVSRDSRHVLVNTKAREVQLVDLETGIVAAHYKGQLQNEFVIRGCFGGADENFVVSGSEDSHIYVWQKQNAQLVEKLAGHTGPVNCVAWNPTNPHMFASAGDDRTIRIWSRAPQPNIKGKMKHTSGFDGFSREYMP